LHTGSDRLRNSEGHEPVILTIAEVNDLRRPHLLRRVLGSPAWRGKIEVVKRLRGHY
jgi:hypothetical protein